MKTAVPCYARPAVGPLDNLDWAGGIAFESYGLRIGVRVNSLELMARVQECLPPGWQAADSSFVDYLYSLRVGTATGVPGIRAFGQLYADGQQVAQSLELDYLLEMLESVVQIYVAEWAPKYIFIHAGAVAWEGKVLVLPGRSFAGKSSLVAELVRAGAGYFSDEYAVLDECGRVWPYPRRLSLRVGGSGRSRCTPEDLGGSTSCGPLPVGWIVATHYRPGARWRPSSLSPGQAVLQLMAHAVPAHARPLPTMAAARAAVRGASCLRGERGEATATAAELLHGAGTESIRLEAIAPQNDELDRAAM
jgi:hypothetical protein